MKLLQSFSVWRCADACSIKEVDVAYNRLDTLAIFMDDPLLSQFDGLFSLLESMISAQARLPIGLNDEWRNDAQVLVVKLFKQMLSARSLLHGATVHGSHGNDAHFIDHSSVLILARSCVEGFLTLHWIFGSEDENLRKFRRAVWKLGGLKDRLKLVVSSDEHNQVISETRLEALNILDEIKRSPFFSLYTENQKIKLISGEWRIGWHWHQEAINAGFQKDYFKNLYAHFSGYAHNGWISVVQTRDATNYIDDQRMLALAGIRVLAHLLGLLIAFYKRFFSAASDKFDASDPGLVTLARRWNLTAREFEELYSHANGGGTSTEVTDS